MIDAAQFLFEAGLIDKVVVVAPAPVRDVWYDPQLGELAKHLWSDLPATVTEFHARVRTWQHGPEDASRRLMIYTSNFEFLRRRLRLMQLLPACGPRTLLVGDESSFLKNAAAEQTKAFMQLRKKCGRVVLLNGTPIFHSPLDLFSQGNILHASVLDCKYITLFKARYAIMQPILSHGGKALTKVVGTGRFTKEIILQEITGWTNLDDLERRFQPHTVRRLQAECLDLPAKLDPVTLTATLEPATWKAYKDMRDDLVVWLQGDRVATSATAAIRTLRLSQITGGFLGGIEDAGITPVDGEVMGDPIAPGFLESLVLPGMAGVSRPAANAAERMPGNLLDAEILGDDDGPDRIQPDTERLRADRAAVGADREDDGRDLHQPAAEQPDAEGHPRRAPADRQPDPLGSREAVDVTTHDGAPKIEVLDVSTHGAVEIGREKLDVLLWFIEQRLEADPNLHLVAWSRFRAEAFRAMAEVKANFPQFETAVLLGGQKKDERLRALALLKPETSPEGPVFVAGIEGTGSFGLDMTAAHTCVTMSTGYSSGRSAQTLDRVYGPGQTHAISYHNIIAVGPRGQATIDRDILIALANGENIAQRTSAAWVRALTSEE